MSGSKGLKRYNGVEQDDEGAYVYYDEHDAALRRAKAEVWQPFETAPKEWNEILVVYTKCRPRVYELVYFNTVHKYWMCKGELRLNLERSECYWMPISNFDDARAAQIEEGE